MPKIGTQLQVLHTQAIALADGGLEVFGPGKIVELREVSGELGLIFPRDGNIGAI